MSIEAIGESFDDPAAILRGEAGTPTPLTLALTWVTDGVAVPLPADDAL